MSAIAVLRAAIENYSFKIMWGMAASALSRCSFQSFREFGVTLLELHLLADAERRALLERILAEPRVRWLESWRRSARPSSRSCDVLKTLVELVSADGLRVKKIIEGAADVF